MLKTQTTGQKKSPTKSPTSIQHKGNIGKKKPTYTNLTYSPQPAGCRHNLKNEDPNNKQDRKEDGRRRRRSTSRRAERKPSKLNC